MIAKREDTRKKGNETRLEKIEDSELQKLVKKEIRRDIRKYEEEEIEEILMESGLTKKVWKEMSTKRKLITKMKNQKGEKETNRKKIT